jgi:VanZ family protein
VAWPVNLASKPVSDGQQKNESSSEEEPCACVGDYLASRNSCPIAGTRRVPSPQMILPSAFEHVAGYAVAAFFLGLACHHRVPPVQLVLLLTAYGALLELGQLWVPGRNGQFSDIGADLAGASIGVMVALVTMRLRRFAPR